MQLEMDDNLLDDLLKKQEEEEKVILLFPCHYFMHFIYPLGTNYIINILSFSLAFLHHDHDRVILILILIRLFRLCLQEDPGGGKGGASGEL